MTISVKKLHAQLKREINEYKISIIYTPIVLSIISLAIAIGTFYYFFIAKLGEVSHIKNLYDAVPMAMYANAGLISGVYFWILINYLTSCLYDDRKSKQILFWRSLPVSSHFAVAAPPSDMAVQDNQSVFTLGKRTVIDRNGTAYAREIESWLGRTVTCGALSFL